MLLIRPNTRKKNYQKLSESLSAIEPPLWMAKRAQELRKRGAKPIIIDEEIGQKIKSLKYDWAEIFLSGNHPSAFIQQREGVERINKLLKTGTTTWKKLPEFSDDLPAWDLFDLKKYRAHNWHCWGGKQRSPYATINTSYGCPFNCSFCCIKDYYGKYRLRDIDLVSKEFKYLADREIENIKIVDELFVFNKKRVIDICNRIKDYNFNIWAYARLDTIDNDLLSLLKSAGINWLGLGIESGNQEIRRKHSKGSFTNKQIKDIIRKIQDSGISIGANYIFGFPDDDFSTMNETLDFAKELKCEYSNFNPMMPFIGSRVREIAIENKWSLPENWSGYSYYSYDCHPVRTKYLTSKQVLQFRDYAFDNFYSNKEYLEYMKNRFGDKVLEELNEMTKTKLKRKLYETE